MPRRLPSLAVALATALVLAAVPTASANTVTVTSTADHGAGTLRDALATAGTGDVISLPGGRYVLSTGALTVPGGVRIAGAGARDTTIDANHTSGVLSAGGPGVTISDVTVTGGQSSAGAGGIASSAGLTLHRVAVVGNVSTAQGGGIASGGAQPLLIDHSLIAGNQSSGGGGIVLTASVTGSSIVASTIAGNVIAGSGSGGGISTSAPGLLLDGDTIVGNHAAGGQGGNFRLNGGMPASIRNTILAGGIAASGDDCYLSSFSVLTSLGHNAEDHDPNPDPDCQDSFTSADHTDLVLALGPLQDNDGPTDTMLPAAGSPVVDQGDATACASVDQRGVARPQGGGCDVGAVERVAGALGSPFADGLAVSAATLHGLAGTAGLGGSARFAYGPTSAYGAFSAATTLPAATTTQGVTAGLTGLLAATTYHFRLEVTTPDGLSAGPDVTFTMPAATAIPPAPAPGPGAAAPFVKASVSRLAGTSRGATLTLTCAASAGKTCRGTVRLQTFERLSGKRVVAVSSAGTTKRRVTVGQKSYSLAAGKSVKLTVALTKTGRSLLTRFKRLPVRAAVTLVGVNGKTTTVSTSRVLTLKPAKGR
jgi:hypothetical protein